VPQPKFLFLDEPFAGVDPVNVNDIKQLVRLLKSEKVGVLITDHNVKETLDICDRAYVLRNGEMLSEGTPQEIVDDKNVRRYYLGEDFLF
jgi:lipopolysaccharide export system ATP-binding protein